MAGRRTGLRHEHVAPADRGPRRRARGAHLRRAPIDDRAARPGRRPYGSLRAGGAGAHVRHSRRVCRPHRAAPGRRGALRRHLGRAGRREPGGARPRRSRPGRGRSGRHLRPRRGATGVRRCDAPARRAAGGRGGPGWCSTSGEGRRSWCWATRRAGGSERCPLDVGSVRITERHLPGDPAPTAEVAAAVADISAALDWVELPLTSAGSLIGVAGTITTLGAMVLDLPAYDRERINLARLPSTEVTGAIDRVLAMSIEERRALPYMHPDRADVIGGGALILRCVVERVGLPELVVSTARHPRRHRLVDGGRSRRDRDRVRFSSADRSALREPGSAGSGWPDDPAAAGTAVASDGPGVQDLAGGGGFTSRSWSAESRSPAPAHGWSPGASGLRSRSGPPSCTSRTGDVRSPAGAPIARRCWWSASRRRRTAATARDACSPATARVTGCSPDSTGSVWPRCRPAQHAGDGQRLISTRMVAAVRCAPPANAPPRSSGTPVRRGWTPSSGSCCRRCARSSASGRSAGRRPGGRSDRVGIEVPRPRPRFGHGVAVTVRLPVGQAGETPRQVAVLGCYHPTVGVTAVRTSTSGSCRGHSGWSRPPG